jgi:hypothetical protein
MDERLENALKFANFRHTLFLEKQRLQEKLKTELSIGYNGGRFYLDRNFLIYLDTITPEEGIGSATLLDEKTTPIFIEDLSEFKFYVSGVYNKAVNEYQMAFQELKTKRTVKAVVDL